MDIGNITFESFTREDKEDYLQFSLDLYATDAVGHTVPLYYYENTFEACLNDNPFVKGLMIKESGKNIGYALLTFFYSNEFGGMNLCVDELFVTENMRSKGVGAAFFKYIESVYNQTMKSIILLVSTENTAAAEFYKRIGFSFNNMMNMYKLFEKEQ